MSFFRKLLGGIQTSADPRARTRQRVAEIVEQADGLYVDDAERALSFYILAIDTADPAPVEDVARREIDRGPLGRAIFSAWQCLQQLGRPAKDVERLLEEASIKSPITARRIEDRLLDQKTTTEESESTRVFIDRLREANEMEPHELVATVQQLWRQGQEVGAWWDLRAGGRSLLDQGYPDLAERLLEAALSEAIKRRGNVSSVYEVMGDLNRGQGRYRQAAGQYLLSCQAGSPSRRTVHELKSCLEAAGTAQPDRVHAELLELSRQLDPPSLLRRLDQMVTSE